MGTRDKRVDAYIARAAPFAQPILEHLRELVHATCPEVEETIKWGFPNFMYKGMLVSMAAFKAHCSFGFWKGALVLGDQSQRGEGMGDLGRITSLKALPPKKVLVGYLKTAMKLNDEGTAVPKPKAAKKPELPTPKALTALLAKNRKAKAAFEAFSPSHRREYIEWITEAKTDATRQKRLATTMEWLAEGKKRNWKYEQC